MTRRLTLTTLALLAATPAFAQQPPQQQPVPVTPSQRADSIEANMTRALVGGEAAYRDLEAALEQQVISARTQLDATTAENGKLKTAIDEANKATAQAKTDGDNAIVAANREKEKLEAQVTALTAENAKLKAPAPAPATDAK